MKYVLSAAVLTLGLLGCSPTKGTEVEETAAGAEQFRFACAAGSSFTVRYEGDGSVAIVKAGGETYTLPGVPSASGARFSDGKVEFWEHQGEASMTGAAGGPYEGCPRVE